MTEDGKRGIRRCGYRMFYVLLMVLIGYFGFAKDIPFLAVDEADGGWQIFMVIVLAVGIVVLGSFNGKSNIFIFPAIIIAFLIIDGYLIRGEYSAVDGNQASGGNLAAGGGAESYVGAVWNGNRIYLLLFVMGIYLFCLLAERFKWVKYASAVMMFAGLIAAMFLRYDISHMGVMLMVWYIVAVGVECVQSSWTKVKKGSDVAYFLWLLPFLALYFGIAAATPYGDKPYDWAFFISLYNRAQNGIMTFVQSMAKPAGDDFDAAVLGFSEDAKLTGSIGKSDKTVMALENRSGCTDYIYLAGKIYDTFDGRSWTKECEAGAYDAYFDTLETLYAVNRYDGERPWDYIRDIKLGVEYKNTNTVCLFAPSKSHGIMWEEDGAMGVVGDSCRFADIQGYGTRYELSCFRMNLDSGIFGQMTADAGAVSDDYELLAKLIDKYFRKIDDITIEVFLQYRERMRIYGYEYVGINVTDASSSMSGEGSNPTDMGAADVSASLTDISPAAYEFLKNAIADAATDYEKLERLERTLSDFSYSTTPGKLPYEVDSAAEYLDWFLDKKEGYCAHFATAFVLFARQLGYPARYVQGFCVPMGGADVKDVNSTMAHSWPEVYLSGVGWIPFEPTPGYAGLCKTGWVTDRELEDIKKAEAAQYEEAGDNTEGAYTENIENGHMQEEYYPSSEYEYGAAEEGVEAGAKAEKNSALSEMLKFLGTLAAVAIVLVVTGFIIDVLLERRKIKKGGAEVRLRLSFLANLRILKALGYVRGMNETLAEFNGRLDAPEDFICLCEEVLYGNRPTDEEAVEVMDSARKRLLGRLKEQKGRKYFLYRAGMYITRPRM